MPIPVVHTPSTSWSLSPASSSAPRTLSAMIWNMLLLGAKRAGCSYTPASAVLRLRLIGRSLDYSSERKLSMAELVSAACSLGRWRSEEHTSELQSHVNIV